ncbi:uncharacterized protein TNCV_2584241 [Trichonephila clavipes]|nr:uncharacterized protein TNCV_2584241 [Trichonephila clavipes]
MSSNTFSFYKAKVLNGHLIASNQLLLDVRKNVREAYGSKNDKYIVDIGVSFDGSWLTRGHTSNIGVGCVIDLLTGFVIDYEVMSKRCGECEQTKFALEEDSAEFRIWYEGHQNVCSATHVGSSGAMEVNAAIKLWERSESIGFRYTTLLFEVPPVLTTANKFATLSKEVESSVSLSESVAPASNDEHFNTSQIPKPLKQNSKKRRKRTKVQKQEIEIKMAKHQPRKSAPTEYTTDDEDMLMYDVEEELESDPTDKIVVKECPTNFPKGYLRSLTPT